MLMICETMNKDVFFPWDRAKKKSLVSRQQRSGIGPCSRINSLENDDISLRMIGHHYQGQWVGFYINRGEDTTFVLQCANDFAPPCMQLHHLSMPFPVQCFTFGTHSPCLREWENPKGEMVGFLHKVKITSIDKGPQKKGKIKEVVFFYGKMATLGWDPDCRRWVDGLCFLNYTTKFGRDFVINRNLGITCVAEKWQGYLPGKYRFYWLQVWDPVRSGTKATFMWSIWHKVVVVNK